MESETPCCLYIDTKVVLQEVTLKDNELSALRKQIEREFLEKVKMDDYIMEKIQTQLTVDKAAQYTKKVTDKLRRRTTELVSCDSHAHEVFGCIDLSSVKKTKEKS